MQKGFLNLLMRWPCNQNRTLAVELLSGYNNHKIRRETEDSSGHLQCDFFHLLTLESFFLHMLYNIDLYFVQERFVTLLDLHDVSEDCVNLSRHYRNTCSRTRKSATRTQFPGSFIL